MSAPKSIVWLASYPKSGNTWARMFLANYLANADEPVSINQIQRFGFGDNLLPIYRKVSGGAVDPADARAVLALRNKALGAIAHNGATVNYVKTHNAIGTVHGVELFPAALSRSVIYIVRNPLDVAVSFARHFGFSPEEAVTAMGRHDFIIDSTEQTVRQYVGSWSDHVSSWCGQRGIPLRVFRYEDMLGDPHGAFAAMLRVMGAPVDRARLDKAVRFARFEELAQQEREQGFVEASDRTERFFGSGKAGTGKAALTAELVARMRADHGAIMQKLGYPA